MFEYDFRQSFDLIRDETQVGVTSGLTFLLQALLDQGGDG